MQRRHFLDIGWHAALGTTAGLAWPLVARANSDFAACLREGACAVVIRHAQTEAGIGDPPGFRLDMCSTQRNLSTEGRAQSRRAAAWFAAQGLKPQAVLSSAWCRCRDTADLAFGRHVLWPALNSFFGNADSGREQAAQMRAATARIPRGQFEVWVTHQVNITALTGAFVDMAEAFAVDARGTILARHAFAAGTP